MTPRAGRLAGVVCRWLVVLYPPAFRRRFGRAMVQDLEQLVEEEGAVAALGRMVRDAAVSLPAAWFAFACPLWRAAPQRLLREARFALRSLRRDPGFSSPVVVVLGLAFAAVAVVATVVDAYLVRPLPYPHADRLMSVSPAVPVGLDEAREVMDLPLTWELDVFTLVGDGAPEQVRGAWVGPGYLEAYGVTAALGRSFHPGEFGEGAPAVAMISHALWQDRFGGDPAVVGHTLRTYSSDRPEDGETFTIVGVLPADLWLHRGYDDVIVPLRAPNDLYEGRLRPGVPRKRAEAVLTELARGHPGALAPGERVTLTSVQDRYVARVRPALELLGTAALLVLLVAWGNVGLLFVVRAQRNAGELAIRRALGAGRWALAARSGAEGLVVGLGAGALAAAAATLTLDAVGGSLAFGLGVPVPGGPGALHTGPGALALLVGACCATGGAFGLLPLLGRGARETRPRAASAEGPAARSLQSGVMAAELALSLAVLVAAGLTLRSARTVAGTDLGFDPSGLVTAGLTLREGSYPDAASRVAFHDRLADALAALPGVTSAGIAVRPPMGRRYAPRPVEAQGRLPGPGGPLLAEPQVADRAYLATLGLAPVRGRTFDGKDGPGGEPVVLVSRELAAALWPGEDPLGRRLREGPGGPWRTVIGVVPDVRQDPAAASRGDYYLPWLQEAPRYLMVLLRTRPGASSPIPALRAAVAALDPEVAVADVGSVAAAVRDIGAPGRLLAFLLAGFGTFAALLAVLGLYGTVAYAAARRRRDVAVRLALGARRGAVAALFLRERVGVLSSGLVVGLGAAAVLARLLEGQLRGVSPGDPGTYVAAATLLAAVALLAVWLPARRAARAHPATVLREE